ncbi:MAG: hypothetical protein M0P64_04555 [Candidatus Pacebacteria bacterium]|jgi:glutathione synthase/RimK-type ligase-like ATP-grasp enzyme|nr:hypothetical protein [Candidatus Paceibacterota bacterium]
MDNFVNNLTKENKNILLLVDDRGQFYSSTKEPGASMNVSLIVEKFKEFDYAVMVKGFSELDFAEESCRDFFVLYQSTEDPDLRYKDYVEDVLLGLKISGSILVPKFEYFRAHHNKVFMEILRGKMNYGAHIKTSHFGTIEELKKSKHEFSYPLVIKPSAGSRSSSVMLAHNKKQLFKLASRVSRSLSLTNIERAIKSVIIARSYKNISNHRRKFIVQEFIVGLSGDYKVLVYGDRYYVVRRENRPGDFRASGSGRVSFPEVVSSELLNYAQNIFKNSNTPFMGMDIADSGGQYYLIEFQFVTMGNYALEKSSFYFKKVSNKWQRIEEVSQLEYVFVESVIKYLNTNY